VNRAQSGVAGGSAARGYFLAAAVLLAATPLGAGEPERASPPAAWRGDWSIIRDLGAPGISALSDDEARALIGSAIVLGAGSAKFGKDACSAVTYRLAEQTTDDFLLGFRITRAQLPLRGAQVQTLEALCHGGPYRTLSLLQDGCVIFVWDGRFLQVARPNGAQGIGACTE
jgi:hypothetical protein